MRASITQTLIKKTAACLQGKPPTTVCDIYDTGQPGLVLRLRASGQHAYRVILGRGRCFTLGKPDVLTPEEARGLARDRLSEDAHGKDPIAEKRKAKADTFNDFLDKHWKPYAEAHLRSWRATVTPLEKQFVPAFGSQPLTAITPFAVERWRTARLKSGVKPITVNKELGALKAALSRAVEWKLLTDHPLRGVKRSKEDRQGVVRYLTPQEEQALRSALAARDTHKVEARARHIAWRRARGYAELPEFGRYGDHMTPIVLLALNTGLRRGELLALRWEDVDLVAARLTVRGHVAKSGRTRYVPLNGEAVAVLKEWQKHATTDLVFPGEDDEPMYSLKTAWTKIITAAAKTTPSIADFRFHDLRHTFASKLVQAGVDLNTVRELLGHSDFALTLRYAHLAAENKVAAVAKLVAR